MPTRTAPTSPAKADPEAADDPNAEALVCATMVGEFRDYEDASGDTFPHPAEPGGLPAGWQVRARGEVRDSLTPALVSALAYEVCMVHREAGGWGLVLHEQRANGLTRTILLSFLGSTVVRVYERVRDGQAHPAAVAAEYTVRQHILSLYDLTDEVEAAEATLVGLGAPVTVLPRVLA